MIDNDYVDIIAQLADPLMAKEDSLGNYYLRDGLLYKLGLLCMPSGSYRPQLIREAHHSKVIGNFGIMQTILHLQQYFYWLKIQTDVERHVRTHNSSHPKTWDESLPYIHHSYNRAMHHSIGVSPFEACMGFLPRSPIDLQLTILPSTGSTSEQHGHEQAKHFIEHI